MLTFALQRLSQGIAVVFVVISLTFFMVRLAPGGPFSTEKAMSEQVRQELQARYGLDDPLAVQYARYMGRLLTGDLGPSIQYPGWNVAEIIAAKLPVSLELGIYALVFALAVGVAAGTLAALARGTWVETALTTAALSGICLPAFLSGPLLIGLFAIHLPWFNVAGWTFAADRVLPAVTLGLAYAAYVARLTRGSLADALAQGYIRTARAKGLSEVRVVGVHGLRNALLPVASFAGPAMAGLITGSFVVETIFNIPGLGRFFVTAALNQDYFMVSGCVLFYATALVFLNFLADLALGWLDPRIRSQG